MVNTEGQLLPGIVQGDPGAGRNKACIIDAEQVGGMGCGKGGVQFITISYFHDGVTGERGLRVEAQEDTLRHKERCNKNRILIATDILGWDFDSNVLVQT